MRISHLVNLHPLGHFITNAPSPLPALFIRGRVLFRHLKKNTGSVYSQGNHYQERLFMADRPHPVTSHTPHGGERSVNSSRGSPQSTPAPGFLFYFPMGAVASSGLFAFVGTQARSSSNSVFSSCPVIHLGRKKWVLLFTVRLSLLAPSPSWVMESFFRGSCSFSAVDAERHQFFWLNTLEAPDVR